MQIYCPISNGAYSTVQADSKPITPGLLTKVHQSACRPQHSRNVHASIWRCRLKLDNNEYLKLSPCLDLQTRIAMGSIPIAKMLRLRKITVSTTKGRVLHVFFPSSYTLLEVDLRYSDRIRKHKTPLDKNEQDYADKIRWSFTDRKI